MTRLMLGLICGLGLGVVDVLIMIPLKFEDKRKKQEAMVAAFVDRFLLGFLVPVVEIGVHPVVTGVLLGIGLSLPSAIITRVYLPILGFGIVGGAIVGLIASSVLG